MGGPYVFHAFICVPQAFEESEALAKEMLQMPPVVPIRKEIDVVLSKDPELIGLDTAKYVFTDISFGKTDRVRNCKPVRTVFKIKLHYVMFL